MRLESIVSELEDIVSDEQEKLDNMEDNFSGTERYEKIEEGISALGEAIGNIQTAIDGQKFLKLQNSIDNLI